MNEFGRQYIEYIRSLTQRQYRMGLVISAVLPAIVLLLFRSTDILFLLPIIFVPFISPRGVIQKMRSDNLQTWLCLSGDLKKLFAKIIHIMCKRVATQLFLGLSVFISIYCAIRGVGIDLLDVIYALLLMASTLLLSNLIWILYMRWEKSHVHVIEMVLVIIVCIVPIGIFFIDYVYYIITLGMVDVLLMLCLSYLMNNLTVDKEKFMEGY